MTEALANLHPDLRDLIGQTIAARYRIDGLLGLGGMGAVFRGHHLGLKRDVAIKVLHPDLTRDRDISSRFDREARSASRLDHPNCLQVTDYGEQSGIKYMVMQLLEGRELATGLGEPLPPGRSIHLILQILRGLDHAHRHGVIHRDIKPENVFITRDHDGRETLKIVDFGIAKIIDGPGGGEPEEVDHRTKAGLVFGTPAYMSPEQAAGLQADARTDLYSAGILFYEMLAGHAPFRHEDPVCLVRMQVGADPPPLPSDVPPMLAAIVERMLVKSRDQRYQSAAEVIEALESIRPLVDPDYVSGMISLTGMTPISGIHLPLAPSQPTIREPPRSERWLKRFKSIDWQRVRTTVTDWQTMRSHLQRGWGWVVAQDWRALLRDWRTHIRDWRVLAGIGGVLLLFVLLGMALVGDDEETPPGEVVSTLPNEKPQTREEEGDEDEVVVQDEPAPDPAALAEIDRLLMADRIDDADKLLSPLRDHFPRDAQLMWRQGRVLAKMKGKRAQALAAYGSALDVNPSLIDDRDFYAELYELMRDKKIRDEALDLALHKMGHYGHKFLLELVNDTKKPLSYNDRHRALEELDKDPANRPLINQKLNTALDLLQASQSLRPCTAYADALQQIAAAPDYYFMARVERAVIPTQPGQEEASACEGLPAKRQTVLDMLKVLVPEVPTADTDGEPTEEPAPAPAGEPSGGAKKSSKKRSQRDPECDKFGAAFKKKCWK